jgi:anti-anti-sigma factor
MAVETRCDGLPVRRKRGPLRFFERNPSELRSANVSSSEAPYRFENAGGCAVITFLPAMNEAPWADIEKIGTDLVGRLEPMRNPRFMVDLTQMNHMGSAMVALIVRLWKSIKDRGGKMVVVNRNEMVFEVLRLASLHKVWTIVDSRESGMRELGVSGGLPRGEGAAGSGGLVLPILAVLAMGGAVAGLALIMAKTPIVSTNIALAIEFVFAVLGLIVGTILVIQHTGARRGVGIAVVAVCAISVLVGILWMPDSAVAAPPAEPSTAAPVQPVAPAPNPAAPVAPAPATGAPAASEDDEGPRIGGRSRRE